VAAGADRVNGCDEPRPFGLIVLAGGRARRLGGQDKPGLVVGGATLLAAVLRAGVSAGAEPVVVVGPPRDGLDGVRVVREEPAGAGPVPALRRGLAEMSAPSVAVLAADLPFLRAGQLRELQRAAADADGAVLADDAGRPQWLAGCWNAAVLRRALSGYPGDSLRGLLAPLDPVLVRATTAGPPPWLDCDTPDDLRRAQTLAQESPDPDNW
jgi:molybdopterin-guanine dinucleotide biosynthesis protein A